MPDLGVVPLFYASRPRLFIDGVEDVALSQGVLQLFVEEDEAGLARCELTVGNWGAAAGAVDFLYFGRDAVDFGRPLQVQMGANGSQDSVFEGQITGLEGRFPKSRPPELLLLAEDRLQDLRMTRRTRTFEDVTLEDVARSIASDHGLSPSIDVDAPQHSVLAQLNQSDLAFLRHLARQIDAHVWVTDTTLFVATRTRRDGGELTLTYGQGLHECQILADLAQQRTSVGVSGWDVAGKAQIDATADSAALSNEVVGTSGVSILAQTLGERHDQIVHLNPRNEEQARAYAEAFMRESARQFITGTAQAEGDARLRVGARVDLRGVGALFEGTATVTRVRHSFDIEAGFRTRFDFARADLET